MRKCIFIIVVGLFAFLAGSYSTYYLFRDYLLSTGSLISYDSDGEVEHVAFQLKLFEEVPLVFGASNKEDGSRSNFGVSDLRNPDDYVSVSIVTQEHQGINNRSIVLMSNNDLYYDFDANGRWNARFIVVEPSIPGGDFDFDIVGEIFHEEEWLRADEMLIWAREAVIDGVLYRYVDGQWTVDSER